MLKIGVEVSRKKIEAMEVPGEVGKETDEGSRGKKENMRFPRGRGKGN